jgi:MFS family permease
MATTTTTTPTVSTRAWVVLALGVAAQTAGTVFVSTPAFLIPLLHTERGLSLAQAGLLAAIPTFGMVLTLILWGALADRIGEKWVIAGGLLLTALAAGGAILADGYLMLGLFLLLGGMASASTNSASGRIVVGWFPKHKRGLAMGIRQMSQPLGVTVAAVTIPVIAADAGVGAALFVPFALTAMLAVACAIGLANPPRVAPSGGATVLPQVNPYRRSGFLWRIHAASVLLVVPQFTISTFGLVWLVSEQRWEPLAAGVLVGAAQFVGAIGRIVIGVVSDRVGSRVRPLRWVAVSVASVLLVLAAVDAAHGGGRRRGVRARHHLHRGAERAGVHVGGGNGRPRLVGQGARCAEHRPVHRSVPGGAADGRADRRGRVPAHLRGRRTVPRARCADRAPCAR